MTDDKIKRNRPLVLLGFKPVGDVLKFAKGSESNGTVILPFPNSLDHMASTMSGFLEVDVGETTSAKK